MGIKDNFLEEYAHEGYKLLFTYDQICELGIMLGEIYTLIYKREATNLIVKNNYPSNGAPQKYNFPLKHKYISDREALEEFTIWFFSQQYLVYGIPYYEYSEVFTNREFDALHKIAYNRLEIKRKAVIEQNKTHEAYLFAVKHQLNPVPSSFAADYWFFNCISGGSHRLDVSFETNTWGCGYCKKKGNLQELYDWYYTKHPEKKPKGGL